MASTAAVAAVLVAWGGPASAQQRGPASDCQRLPGGNAPMQRLAGLTTPLAVRSLELTYFGKRLADFTGKDFDELKQIYPACNPNDKGGAETVDRFQAVVLAAQKNRQDTADWIEKVKFEAGGLPATRDGIVRITVLWYEMEQKIPDLMPADAEDLQRYLSRRMNELYAKAPARRAGEELAPVVRPPAAAIEIKPAPDAQPAQPPAR
ncbi:MAG: hypothetical protein FJX35_02405 [Alphaproteobacteria bacterium]|nr:hypothetical protein [Alphaproteobacteria bacterium]